MFETRSPKHVPNKEPGTRTNQGTRNTFETRNTGFKQGNISDELLFINRIPMPSRENIWQVILFKIA